MKVLQALVIAFSLVLLTACQSPGAPVDIADPPSETDANEELFTIGPERVDCVGVGPQKCLVVNGENFYDRIEGFQYQPGYTYEIKVRKTERPEPVPADANRFIYTFVALVSQEAAVPDGCIAWFDGCNNCTVEDGKVAACTRKFCPEEALQEPECLQFDSDLETDEASEETEEDQMMTFLESALQGNGVKSCETLSAYAFPEDMVSDCV